MWCLSHILNNGWLMYDLLWSFSNRIYWLRLLDFNILIVLDIVIMMWFHSLQSLVLCCVLDWFIFHCFFQVLQIITWIEAILVMRLHASQIVRWLICSERLSEFWLWLSRSVRLAQSGLSKNWVYLSYSRECIRIIICVINPHLRLDVDRWSV